MGAQKSAVWRQSFTIDGSVDYDLVAGVGQAVQGAVAEDGVVKETKPFVDGTVAGDDEAGRPVPVEDEFIQIGRLLSGEAVQPRSSRMSRSGVRKDRKARSTELSTLAWVMALKKSSALLKVESIKLN